MSSFAIGVDLGGTNLRIAAVDERGTLLEKVTTGTQVSRGRDSVIDEMSTAICDVLVKHKSKGELLGIGIGVPGAIDLESGMLYKSPNLPGWDNYPVRDEIERRLNTRVILENDANAAALGEKWIGAGRDVDDLVLLTLGTGIGGGIIVGGKVLHGFIGMAGELGHITVVPDGNPCGCGNIGCLEKHASATAVTAMARMLGLGETLTAKAIYDLALAGNEKALRIWKIVGESLGVALANLVNAFNFPLYLLSGGMLGAWDL